jgi:hypothetical protein
VVETPAVACIGRNNRKILPNRQERKSLPQFSGYIPYVEKHLCYRAGRAKRLTLRDTGPDEVENNFKMFDGLYRKPHHGARPGGKRRQPIEKVEVETQGIGSGDEHRKGGRGGREVRTKKRAPETQPVFAL